MSSPPEHHTFSSNKPLSYSPMTPNLGFSSSEISSEEASLMYAVGFSDTDKPSPAVTSNGKCITLVIVQLYYYISLRLEIRIFLAAVRFLLRNHRIIPWVSVIQINPHPQYILMSANEYRGEFIFDSPFILNY